jgi:hypothetical protein
MRPTEVGERISLANDALFNLGSSAFLGDAWGTNSVEYISTGGETFEFRPMKDFGDADVE